MKFSDTRLPTVLAGLVFLPTLTEHPYLDPGSGSFILQMLIAGAAGAVFILRNQIARFFGFFHRNKNSDKKAETKRVTKRNAK